MCAELAGREVRTAVFGLKSEGLGRSIQSGWDQEGVRVRQTGLVECQLAHHGQERLVDVPLAGGAGDRRHRSHRRLDRRQAGVERGQAGRWLFQLGVLNMYNDYFVND